MGLLSSLRTPVGGPQLRRRSSAPLTQETWQRGTERPLLLAALIFLVVLCMPIIEPTLTGPGSAVVRVLNIGIWALFAIDYFVQLWLADDRRRYVRTHLADLAVVVLPALRPLRLLRLLSVGRIVARRGTSAVVTNATQFVAGAAALMVFLGSVGVLAAERGAHGANIRTFRDALWWSCTTITTVGYGDRYPVTNEGRLIAVGLMIFGLALLGILTASIAAWFVHHISREHQIETQVRIEAQELVEIRDQLAQIRRQLGIEA